MLFNSFVLPHFDYTTVVWGTACGTQIKYVYNLQKRAARILTGGNSDRKDSISHSCIHL